MVQALFIMPFTSYHTNLKSLLIISVFIKNFFDVACHKKNDITGFPSIGQQFVIVVQLLQNHEGLDMQLWSVSGLLISGRYKATVCVCAVTGFC